MLCKGDKREEFHQLDSLPRDGSVTMCGDVVMCTGDEGVLVMRVYW